MLSKKRKIILGGIAMAVAVIIFSALVPVPHNFTMHGAAIFDPNTSCSVDRPNTIDTTGGTNVDFHWSAPSPTIFFVVSCSANQVAYTGNGTNGSGAFVSAGGVYQFGSSCPEGPCIEADVSGSFTGPILPL
jgi:hypothetical protein